MKQTFKIRNGEFTLNIKKIALLGVLIAVTLAPKASFTMDYMYETICNDIELDIQEKKDELQDILSDTDCFNAIYLTHKNDEIKNTSAESRELAIKLIKFFWEPTYWWELRFGIVPLLPKLKNEVEYLQWIEKFFNERAKSFEWGNLFDKFRVTNNTPDSVTDTIIKENTEFVESKAKEWEKKYWEKFNAIRKEKIESNYKPIKYALNFTNDSEYKTIYFNLYDK